jgi:DNA-binding LacI/PurR family transcriptional regulator
VTVTVVIFFNFDYPYAMATAATQVKARPRLRDIADKAHLSVTTVSMALRGSDEISADTRNRVSKLAQHMGYTVRSAGRRTRKLARPQQRFGMCLIGTESGIAANALIRGASGAALQVDARIEISMIENLTDRQRVLTQLADFGSQLSGLLLWGMIDRWLIEGLATAALNAIVLGDCTCLTSELPEDALHVVSHDTTEMGLAATSLLLSRGHKRIGFICEEMPPRMYNARWLAGYRHAMWEAGVPIDESLIVVCGVQGTAGERGSAAILALPERPTAYVLSDGTPASLFLEAMKRHGAVPPPDAVVIGAAPEQVERYGLRDYSLIISNFDRMASIALTALHRATHGMPLLNGRLEVPFSTRNF